MQRRGRKAGQEAPGQELASAAVALVAVVPLVEVESVAEGIIAEVAAGAMVPPDPRRQAPAFPSDLEKLLRLAPDPGCGYPNEHGGPIILSVAARTTAGKAAGQVDRGAKPVHEGRTRGSGDVVIESHLDLGKD